MHFKLMVNDKLLLMWLLVCLEFCKHDVYALLDPSATLSFMIPYVAMRFNVLSYVLLDLFCVSTVVCYSSVANRI